MTPFSVRGHAAARQRMTAVNAEEEAVHTGIFELLDLIERADRNQMSIDQHAHAV